jgi:hypothetical protein
MKKYIIGLILLFAITVNPLSLKAAAVAKTTSITLTKPAESAEVKALLLRINEINTMDKSHLNKSEKKNLRIEVRSIRHELNERGGGIYLSAGGLIIIVLLLIIIF